MSGLQSVRGVVMAGVVLAGALPASAAVIFDTGNPGGFFGYYGYDVFTGQSVAIGFTPDQDYTLDELGVWMMSNDFEAAGRTYTLSLRTDASGGTSTPSNTVIESWDMSTTAVGWEPVLEVASSVLNPLLSAGTTYWIVAESSEPGGLSPVWVVADSGIETPLALIDFQSSPDWFGGTSTGVPGGFVSATPVPTPAAFALLGAAGLFGQRRRR